MQPKRHTSRRTASILVAVFAILAAASPAFAKTGLEHLDGQAIALIAAIGILLFAIVFEVWRLTLKQELPATNRRSRGSKRIRRD